MGEETIIVAIVFGSILGMITIPMLFSLAKKWIDRNNNSYDEQAFDRLAKAFIKHKKESERRFQNLEAIIAGEEPESEPAAESNRSLDERDKEKDSHQSIEIDTEEKEKEQKKKSQSGGGNLRNMLKE
jgi:hypothetical protein